MGHEASWWKTASGPRGYGMTGVITDTRSDMARKTPTLYLRKEFTLTAEQANQLEAVVLEANYEDGLVVFLNGYEVARRNAGQANRQVFHHQVAFNEHLAGTVEAIPLNLTEGRLRTGVNVIAVQGMDHDLEDNRFFLSVSLKMGSTTLVSSTEPWSYLVGKFEPSGRWIDPTDFTAAYPGVTIAGVYLGSLANEGETLRLVDIRGNPIFSVTYSDARLTGWPAEPDGEGYSLVLMRPEKWGNTVDPAHWRASARTSGAPGQRDRLSFDSASAIADADGDGYPALVEYVTGSDDQGAHLRPRVDLSLGESGSELKLTFEKNLAVDDTDVVVEWSVDLVRWTLATKQTSRRLATGMMEEVWVKPTAPSERPVYWRLRATLHP